MKEARVFSKFFDKSVETLKEQLINEAKVSTEYFPYGLAFMSRPLFIWLGYMTSTKKLEEEFIEITKDGFKFHDITFTHLKNVVTYLKENFKATDYQQFLKNTKTPIETISKEVDLTTPSKSDLFWKDTGLCKHEVLNNSTYNPYR